jgi:hypothetical protein
VGRSLPTNTSSRSSVRPNDVNVECVRGEINGYDEIFASPAQTRHPEAMSAPMMLTRSVFVVGINGYDEIFARDLTGSNVVFDKQPHSLLLPKDPSRAGMHGHWVSFKDVTR